MAARATYDSSTPVGLVRLLMADTDIDNPIFVDVEIQAVLPLNDQSPRRSAAMLLDTIASNRARLAVHIRRGGVSEDLTKVQAALHEQAESLRADADKMEDDAILESISSPSYERFSHTVNIYTGRQNAIRSEPPSATEEPPADYSVNPIEALEP